MASRAKVEQIRAYGATLEIGGERYADALAASEQFAQRSGALRVHAFDQLETLQGQATVGMEFEQDAPGLDALLVAVGGGGLIGGIAAWYRGRVPLIGVEPSRPRRSPKRWPRVVRSMRRPAASLRIRWRRARSGASCFPSRNALWLPACW